MCAITGMPAVRQAIWCSPPAHRPRVDRMSAAVLEEPGGGGSTRRWPSRSCRTAGRRRPVRAGTAPRQWTMGSAARRWRSARWCRAVSSPAALGCRPVEDPPSVAVSIAHQAVGLPLGWCGSWSAAPEPPGYWAPQIFAQTSPSLMVVGRSRPVSPRSSDPDPLTSFPQTRPQCIGIPLSHAAAQWPGRQLLCLETSTQPMHVCSSMGYF